MSEPLVVIGNGMAAARLVEELSSARARPLCHRGRRRGAAARLQPRAAVVGAGAAKSRSSDIELKPAQLVARSRRHAALRLPRDRDRHADAHASRSRTARRCRSRKLVLATGSQPIRLRSPAWTCRACITFRDLGDVCDHLAARRPGDRVGRDRRRPARARGGLWSRQGRRARHACVHLMDRLMERQLDARAAAMLKRAVEAQGIEVVSTPRPREIDGARPRRRRRAEGRPHASRPMLSSSRSASGRTPISRATQASRSTAASWSTMRCETNIAGIHAIGECAEHRGICYGLVEPAYEQARVLAERLAGRDARYAGSVLATNLKVSGVNVFSAGDFLGRDGTEEIVLSDPGHRHSTRSSSSRTAASSARCCSAIPPTASGIST